MRLQPLKKALQIFPFRAKGSVSDRAAVRGPREARCSRFRNDFAKTLVVDPRGELGCHSRSDCVGFDALRARGPPRAGGSGASPGRTVGPRDTVAERLRQSLQELRLELRELECPRGRGRRDVQLAVSRQPRRPGVASDLLAHRLGPRAHDLVIPPPARSATARAEPRRRSAPASSRAPRNDLDELGRLRPAARGSRRGHERLAGVRKPLGQGPAAALVELREHVVEQQKRRRRPAFREQPASASSSERTASRCSPCDPNRRRSRPSVVDSDVVEMGPEAGRPAIEVIVQLASRPPRRRVRLVHELRSGQAELRRPLGERRREKVDGLRAARDERLPQLGHAFRPRRDRVA